MLFFQNAVDYEVTPAPDSVVLQQLCTPKELKEEIPFESVLDSETCGRKCSGTSLTPKKYHLSPGLLGLLINQR